MKTLADVKRRIVPGVRLEVIEQTRRPHLVGQVRTVTSTRPSRYDVTLSDDDGTGNAGKEYPIYWPKAAQVRVIDPDTWEYDLQPAGSGHVRLRFLPAAGS